jgi:Photosynthetic reaction centre cytochrome C subunit
MRLLQIVLLSALAMCGAIACEQGTLAQQTAAAGTPTPPPAAQARESTQEINDRYVKQIADRIAGHQSDPAEQVFKNIQWLKGVPAERLLLIMNLGYSRALGVSCTHCHVEADFSSDDKRPKRAAREMAAMHRMINDQLKKMQNLETPAPQRAINCSTCHRGAIDPVASER